MSDSVRPIEGSPPGSPVPGILPARTLEWVAISISNAWKWKVKVKSLSRAQLLATPWTAAYHAPPSMWFSRQEYWSGVPLPSLNYGLFVLFIWFFFFFNPIPYHFDYYSVVIWFEIRKASSCVLFFSRLLWLIRFFCGFIKNFSLFYYYEKYSWNVDKDCFEYYRNFKNIDSSNPWAHILASCAFYSLNCVLYLYPVGYIFS